MHAASPPPDSPESPQSVVGGGVVVVGESERLGESSVSQQPLSKHKFSNIPPLLTLLERLVGAQKIKPKKV